MPEALSAALLTEGLVWLIAAFVLAGLVRGFTGFGTAMIVVPIGALFIPLPHIIFVLALTGVTSAAMLIPKAWTDANRTQVFGLAVAALLAMPIGSGLLAWLDPVWLRWMLVTVILFMILALVFGWRYHGQLSPAALALIGVASGIIGGASGLTGPVLVLFYLASLASARTVRANTILFLVILDFGILANLMARGMADWSLLWLAILVGVPYTLTVLIGQALFQPAYERFYRTAAYAIITFAALSGLPIFD